MIETADDTAVDEAASLERNEPDREVGSLNRFGDMLHGGTGVGSRGAGGASAGAWQEPGHYVEVVVEDRCVAKKACDTGPDPL